jgi:hypothetical protein
MTGIPAIGSHAHWYYPIFTHAQDLLPTYNGLRDSCNATAFGAAGEACDVVGHYPCEQPQLTPNTPNRQVHV